MSHDRIDSVDFVDCRLLRWTAVVRLTLRAPARALVHLLYYGPLDRTVDGYVGAKPVPESDHRELPAVYRGVLDGLRGLRGVREPARAGLITYQEHVRRFGGIVVILFGLYLLGILNLNFLKTEHRYQFRSRPAGYAWILFDRHRIRGWMDSLRGAGVWEPSSLCEYDRILVQRRGVAQHSTLWGWRLPLFLTALGVDRFLSYFKEVRAYLWGVSTVSGVLLIVVGVMIYGNSLTMITSFLERYGIGWYLGQ